MDVRMIGRTKRKSLLIALPTLFGPLILGGFVATLLLKDLDLTEQPKVALMISLHSMVSLPVIENVLSELKILNSEIGHLGLSAALIGDILSQLGIIISNIIRVYQVSPKRGFISLVGFSIEAFLVCFVFKPAVVWIIKRTPKGKPVSSTDIQAVICLVLLSSVVSVLLAQPAISGPYLLGLIIPNGSPLIISMVDKLDFFLTELFIPIFIAMSALQADLSKIFIAFGSSFTQFNIVVGFVTFSVKVISSFVGSLYCNLPVQDSLALAFLMSNKGIVELVFITILRGYNIISDGLLIWLTVMILIVATLSPFPVKYLYDPSIKYGASQNRNIMNLPKNSELRILVCVHQNKDAHGLIHLLNLSCPTKQHPLAIYVLHLVELVGRITPIFISHKQESYNYPLSYQQESLSGDIVHCFDNFEREKNGTVNVECFTTITRQKFMLSEICKLGLEKTTSLIILPFHQTWTADGHIDQDDQTIRTLNWGVIEKGPCSVGIFANRGNLGSTMSNCDSYAVCVIFLGGNDDREAISYAKRLAKDSRVELTVLRLFVSSTMEDQDGSCNEHNWEKMLDSEALRDFKMNCFGDGRVKYIEGVSEDGTHTAMRVRKMVNEFDLMIVGRRKGLEQSSPQTWGLSEWNDFPELGILGDLIVSLDINIRASVLVIQQTAAHV
ncbi:cation/H(+) antiporter 3-like [Benincasa hispida]|uniref:cation/H(+) antiporter 3-like n=1 Tax=Benincasa hispida TaxID=102211 RepID=UPI00190204DE|nr:cation/H(+) antiporter 3-like [Benincasa hispida]